LSFAPTQGSIVGNSGRVCATLATFRSLLSTTRRDASHLQHRDDPCPLAPTLGTGDATDGSIIRAPCRTNKSSLWSTRSQSPPTLSLAWATWRWSACCWRRVCAFPKGCGGLSLTLPWHKGSGRSSGKATRDAGCLWGIGLGGCHTVSPLPWQAISGAGEGVFITTLALPLKEWRAQARICHWAKKGGHHWRGDVTAPPALPFRGALVEVGWRQPCMTAYAPLFASDLQDAHRRYSPMDALAPVLKLSCQRIR
jgi:hypothetical protein